MLATAFSATLVGLDAHLVRVEVEVARGVPSFELVGLAEATVRESRVRVKSALFQVGVDLSEYRIVVNLAPADVRKVGSAFDVGIAAATLAALGRVPLAALRGVLFLGELSLTGAIHPVRGVLPRLVGVRGLGLSRAIVPEGNGGEAALVQDVTTETVSTLRDLLHALRGERELPRAVAAPLSTVPAIGPDLEDVRGQAGARRALEVAAAGGHNLLMIGPPGAGKTMLARRLPGILPALSAEEALEVTALHSIAGLLGAARGLVPIRPFRAPHHTVSEVGLVGGGDSPRPGEVSLAHQGVLFLDELAEFKRCALESLRQPLEDGVVTISRAQAKATFPARPLVVAAMNPCACGYRGDGSSRCACTKDRVASYRARLSGPLLDRLDIHVVLPPGERRCAAAWPPGGADAARASARGGRAGGARSSGASGRDVDADERSSVLARHRDGVCPVRRWLTPRHRSGGAPCSLREGVHQGAPRRPHTRRPRRRNQHQTGRRGRGDLVPSARPQRASVARIGRVSRSKDSCPMAPKRAGLPSRPRAKACSRNGAEP
jgi:magnesium chelatase family protein